MIKKYNKKIILVFLSLALIFCAAVLAIQAEEATSDEIVSETHGTITWTLNRTTGVMTLEGTGDSFFGYSPQETPYYYYMSEIKELVVCEGITGIGECNFTGCENLTKVTLPDSLKTLYHAAFHSCTKLEDVDLGNGVTTFEDLVFGNCTSLKQIELPESVTNLGWCVFGYTGITSLTLPESMTHINEYSFFESDNFKEIIVKCDAVSIDNYAFKDCSNLEKVTFAGKIVSVGEECFYGCTNLSLNPVLDVETVESNAFYDCTKLKSVSFSNKITSIGDNAFYGCTALTDVYYSGTKSEWDAISIRQSNSALTDATIHYLHTHTFTETIIKVPGLEDGLAEYTCECGFKRYEVLPATGDEIVSETINGMTWMINKTTGLMTVEGSGSFSFGCSPYETPYYDYFDYIKELIIYPGITGLGESAFDGCANLTKVTLPDSMKHVAWYAFARCTSLTDVDLGNGVTTIESSAFDGCSALASIEIPPSVTTISSGAFAGTAFETFTIPDTVTKLEGGGLFYDCKLLKSVTLPKSATAINQSMFYGCTALEEIVIPDTVTLIDDMAFYGCTALTTVTVEGNLSEIGQYSFFSCSNLETVDLQGKVTVISKYAFQKCTKLKNIVLPKGLEAIGEGAFAGCSVAFESIIIPSSVKDVGGYAFSGCSSLKSVVIDADLQKISEGMFNACSELSSINIPDTVSSIGSHAFDRCKSLTEIKLPSALTLIGSYAFAYCTSISRIDIPDGVVTIGRVVFTGCSSLTDLTLPDSVEYIYETAFINTPFYNNSDNWVDGVLYIDNHLIIAKTSLSGNYEIRPGTKSIACYAFDGCSSLSSVTIPESVHGFGNYCFDYSVETIKYDAINATSGAISTGDFRLKVGTNIIFGDKVEKIPAYTCYNCDELQNVYLPKSLKAIGNYAFAEITPGFTVYYAGSATEWNQINLGTGNTSAIKKIIYNHIHSYDSVTIESSTQTTTEVKHSCICGDFTLETIPACGFYTKTGIKVDYDSNTIYGLPAGIRSLDKYTSFTDDSYMWAYANIDSGFGTGTVAVLLDETSIIGKYTILIYGDIDGNGWYDANDAFIVNMIMNGLISPDLLTAAQLAAADCNHDGEINELDFNLLIDASLLKNEIDQLPEETDIETNAVFIQYNSIIDQSEGLAIENEIPEAQKDPSFIPDSESETAQKNDNTRTILVNIFEFIKQIIAFLLSVFMF